jgi:hypothetical protein
MLTKNGLGCILGDFLHIHLVTLPKIHRKPDAFGCCLRKKNEIENDEKKKLTCPGATVQWSSQ